MGLGLELAHDASVEVARAVRLDDIRLELLRGVRRAACGVWHVAVWRVAWGAAVCGMWRVVRRCVACGAPPCGLQEVWHVAVGCAAAGCLRVGCKRRREQLCVGSWAWQGSAGATGAAA